MAKIKKAQVGRLVKKAVGAIDKKLVKSAGRDVEKMTTKGGFNSTPKSMQKPTTKIEAKIANRESKIAKDNSDYDKAVWESYQKNGGKTVKKTLRKGGSVKKAQTGKKVTPSYKNLRMGVKNEQYQMSGVNRDIKPSAKDSARYRGGFEQGLKGMKGMPNEGQVEKMGRWEGQNVKPKQKKGGVTKKKMKTGGTLAPSKKSVGKTFGKLNKAKYGTSKKK